MLYEKQNETEKPCFASRAEIKRVLMEGIILKKELESKTIQSAFKPIKVMSALNEGAGKVLYIMRHMRMLNFDLKILKSFLQNLGRDRKDVQLIGSIRSDITSLVM